MAITSETKFRPVISTEEKILAFDSHPGYVYFAEDTKKIFLDIGDENKMVMGGSGSVIFYASDTNVEDTGFDGMFNLHRETLEDDNAKRNIKENDLIINSDNCFYRVLSTEAEDILSVTKIAVVGSSGGGGGQGPGGDATVGKASVTAVTPVKLNHLSGDECVIDFDVIALDSSGQETSGGTVTWTLDKKTIASQSVANGRNSFDVSKYLSTNSGTQTLKGTFSLDVGTATNSIQYKSWNIEVIDVSLDWEYEYDTVISRNQFDLKWSVTGGNNIDKTTHINILDNNLEIVKPITTVGAQSFTVDRDEYGLDYGTYKFEMYVEFTVNGIVYKTKSITKELIFVNSEQDSGIISLGDFNITEMTQYDTLMIPIYVYNAETVTLLVDGEEVETWPIGTQTDKAYFDYWSYTPTEEGEKILKIEANGAEKNIVLKVEKLEISAIEATGYAFKLKASEFSSNNALKNWEYINPEKEKINLTFSENFDWVNGGIKTEEDENGTLRNYICVKSGTRMTINYKLFKTFNQDLGKDIKIIFKVANCGNYDAEVIKCLGLFNPSADEESQKQVGLKLLAQDGYLYSTSNTINVRYCEDNYIEYEMDIAPHGKQQYIMPWLNGVPAGITVYSSDEFTQHQNELSDIVIGSDDCDVYLYLFKVYEKHLTNNEHLDNFIMDALNASEILARYQRNDILNDNGNGEIDWKKVLTKNPDCWIHLYKIPRMTKTKKDEIGWDKSKGDGGDFTDEVAKYYALYKDGDILNPVIQAGTEVGCKYTFKVQGTSSEKYVISAANLDTNFREGMIDADGNKVKKFSLDSTVPGEKYFNSKVNVASCEGANNALNAAWYNDHQPYTSLAKKKNSSKRDTMLFKPGIIFMIDENSKYTKGTGDTNLDLNVFKGDEVYEKATEKFYKQYAICNFGNSKKNKDTLHDPDNIHEVCIEVTDNQNIGQRMTAVMGRDNNGNPIDITNGDIDNDNTIYQYFYATCNDGDYDIRYTSAKYDTEDPGNDGVANASPQQLKGFFKLVQWFAKNDPCEYDAAAHPYGWTGAELAEPVTYEPYTFRSKDWKGDSTKLGGFKVSTYAGIYTHDTHEYRMAKLLAECEDHLIMDSIVYHYLFIERHLMVDNVAKNTFWGSEDENNQYWNLIKDYDNDTADGIDNDGKLSFTYGIEPGDTYNGGLSYFNAETSVWFNFLQGLETVNTQMYQLLETSGVWNSKEYLEKFTEWQNCIPERCWIEDYYRKYIRPFEIYEDDGYLKRLEGGKKDLQRAQFEKYQETYMNTKYAAKAITDSYIYIRANSTDISGTSIPVTMYSDCYVYQSWSQNIIRQRAKRGESILIKCPEGITAMDNATVYWYAPSTYSKIGNIGELNPQLVQMGESTKLQELEISGTESNPLLSLAGAAPSIQQATLIKRLKLNYLSNLNNGNGTELNLSNQKSLNSFEAIGSNFTSLIFPEGAPIESIKVNNPGTLKMRELRHLSELEIQNYNAINSLYIDNIDESEVNSLNDLVLPIGNNLVLYDLENVKWHIDDASQIDDETHSIKVLDSFENKTPRTFDGNNSTKEKALTGSLLISKNAYSANNALDIYNKYISIYPNLEINFEDESSKLSTITILDGNGKERWSRKFQGSVILNSETLSQNGPQGLLEDLLSDIILKTATTQYIYTFGNQWSINDEIITVSEDNLLPINDKTYIEDIVIKPLFEQSLRKYTINFYVENELQHSDNYSYGTAYADLFNSLNFVPYKDDSTLEMEKTYGFMGWTTSANSDIVITTGQVQREMNFYSNFKEVSVYENVLSDSCFDFLSNSYSKSEYDTLFIPNTEGYYIRINKNNLRGKITLPLMHEGKYIYGISQGEKLPEVTHVFWEGDYVIRNGKKVYDYGTLANGEQLITQHCVEISPNAFWTWKKMKYFQYPVTLRSIETCAFQSCHSLELPDWSKLNNLIYLGSSVYNDSFTILEDDAKVYIPGSVKYIGYHFMIDLNSNSSQNGISMNKDIQVLQFGKVGDPFTITNKNNIGENAFRYRPTITDKSFKNLKVYFDEDAEVKTFLYTDSTESDVDLSSKIAFTGTYQAFGTTKQNKKGD